ncbi:MAG TPA: hypothetical protein VFY41_06030 [Nitrososphaeraceae archaeon]|nr:hypothetical protein [Nitrososphaeraceae archaeon]
MPPCVWMYLYEQEKRVLFLVGVILTNSVIYQALAETGKGDDVFRVIMTIFGVDKSRGDVVAIITVNNGEASKVRFLDSDIAAGNGGIIEYVGLSHSFITTTAFTIEVNYDLVQSIQSSLIQLCLYSSN